MSEVVSVQDLVIHCVELAVLAGEEIERVLSLGPLQVVNKWADSDSVDPQTLADRNAESIIIGGLRARWKDLRIIGEEEVHSSKQDSSQEEQEYHHLQEQAQQDQKTNDGKCVTSSLVGTLKRKLEHLQDIQCEVNRLSVFVDPLDGTRSFVAERYEFVSTLIGVCIDGIAVAGVIGSFKERQVIFGGTDVIKGVFKWEQSSPDTLEQLQRKENHKAIGSRSRSGGIVEETVRRLSDLGLAEPELVKASGCGYKFKQLLLGNCGLYVFPRPGVSMWDICGCDALIHALGGAMRTAAGDRITYDANCTSFEFNEGFVAATDPETCMTICTQVTATLDVVKFSRGLYLNNTLLETLLGLDSDQVSGFRSWNHSAIRQKHCTGVQIEVVRNGGLEPLFLFYKRTVPSELASRPANKWRRDIASYLTEANFIQHVLSHLTQSCFPKVHRLAASCGLPSSMNADKLVELSLDKITSTVVPKSYFCLFEEDLSQTHVQKEFLNLADISQCLQALESLHTASTQAQENARAYLWSNGCYWSLDKRPVAEIDTLSIMWSGFFSKLSPLFQNKLDDFKDLGKRLLSCARNVSQELSASERKTLVHGDCKAANLFFHANTNEVKLIDFQWTGFGVPAADIMYLLLSSAESEVLESLAKTPDSMVEPGSQLDKLLRDYVERTKVNNANFDAFLRDFALCVVDYARVVITYQWGRTVSPEYFRAGEGVLGRCSHNKSLQHVAHFCRIVDVACKFIS